MNKGARTEFILVTMGLLCILFSASLLMYNVYSDHRAGEASADIAAQLESRMQKEGLIASEDRAARPAWRYQDYPDADMPVMTVRDEAFIGILYIPSLELSLPVYSEWSPARLKSAPCRFSGTVYAGDLVIAAHNYAAHFGSVYSLQTGDPVYFTDVNGQRFSYEVAILETLSAGEVDRMVNSEWDLTLFTCTVGGRSRVTVRCRLVSAL